jgi:uncharacterized membrane protein
MRAILTSFLELTMTNKIVALLMGIFSLVCFYYAIVYARQGEGYANHFMIGLGVFGMVVSLTTLLGK